MRYWHPDGRPRHITFYDRGHPIGWHTSWDRDGKVMARGRFRDGRPWDGSFDMREGEPRRWVTRYYLHGNEITKAEYEKALAAGKVPSLKAGKELEGIDLKPQPAPKVKGGKAGGK